MGAKKDGNPTSLNKWERKKAGTLPRETGQKAVTKHSLYFFCLKLLTNKRCFVIIMIQGHVVILGRVSCGGFLTVF